MLPVIDDFEGWNPDFAAFCMTGASVSTLTGKTMTAPYGEHGPGCECNINKTVMVFAHDNGLMGFGIHKDADLVAARNYLGTLVGPKAIENILNDDGCSYGYHVIPKEASAGVTTIEEPDWLKGLNMGILSDE